MSYSKEIQSRLVECGLSRKHMTAKRASKLRLDGSKVLAKGDTLMVIRTHAAVFMMAYTVPVKDLFLFSHEEWAKMQGHD